MVELKIQMPDGALASLRKDPAAFAEEMRLVAAVKWYELGLVSQGRAAEIAGVSRQAFIDALGRLGVTVFQCDEGELVEEAERA